MTPTEREQIRQHLTIIIERAELARRGIRNSWAHTSQAMAIEVDIKAVKEAANGILALMKAAETKQSPLETCPKCGYEDMRKCCPQCGKAATE